MAAGRGYRAATDKLYELAQNFVFVVQYNDEIITLRPVIISNKNVRNSETFALSNC